MRSRTGRTDFILDDLHTNNNNFQSEDATDRRRSPFAGPDATLATCSLLYIRFSAPTKVGRSQFRNHVELVR